MFYIKRETISKNTTESFVVDENGNIIQKNFYIVDKENFEIHYYKKHPYFEESALYSPDFEDKTIFNTEQEAIDKLSILMQESQNTKMFTKCNIKFTIERS